tara:strand:+ start:73465 stop:73641 length:177 start_codon:yes stop_codon:yes gene_type:complete
MKKLIIITILSLTVSLGVLTDNLALWLSVGLAIGAGVGTSLMKQGDKKDGGDSSNNHN